MGVLEYKIAISFNKKNAYLQLCEYLFLTNHKTH